MSIHSSNNRVGGSESTIYTKKRAFVHVLWICWWSVALVFCLKAFSCHFWWLRGNLPGAQRDALAPLLLRIVQLAVDQVVLRCILHRVPWRIYKETLLQSGLAQFVQKIRAMVRLALYIAPITCCISNTICLGCNSDSLVLVLYACFCTSIGICCAAILRALGVCIHCMKRAAGSHGVQYFLK